ncbi:heparinase, partial [Clostridium perfringens]|nr:heparinase [Clostridium perfringens]
MDSNNVEKLKIKVKKYMVSYEKENVVNYIKNQCKDSYKETLKGANFLLNNSFIFDEAWDMEQCKIPYVNRKLDWNYTPNGDEEWT